MDSDSHTEGSVRGNLYGQYLREFLLNPINLTYSYAYEEMDDWTLSFVVYLNSPRLLGHRYQGWICLFKARYNEGL